MHILVSELIDMKISKKKVISDSLFLTAGDFLLKLKGVIFIPIIISSVGMDNYGAFVQILVNVGMIVPFCTLALGMGFYRYTSKYDETEVEKLSRDYWTVSTTVFILSIFGALVAYLFSPIISKYILAGSSLNSLRLSSLLVVNRGLYYIDILYIEGRKKFKLSSIYLTFQDLAPYLGFIAGIMLKHEIFFGLLLYLIIQTALILSLKVYVIKALKFSNPSIKILRKFIKYSWALMLSSFTGGLLSKVDKYFIGYFLGPASIGIYNIVCSVCGLLDNFSVPFRKYFGTYLSKAWDEGKQNNVQEQLNEGLLYYLIISIGALAGITFLLRPAVKLLINKDFSSIENFEWLVLLTGLGILGLGTARFFYQLIKYKEQNHLQLIFQSISVVLNIGLNYLLVKEYGIIGAGMATFVSYLTVVVMCNYYLNMNLGISFLTKLLRIGIASLAIILWLYFHPVKNSFDLGLNIIAGLFIYFIFIFLFRVIRFQDIKSRFV